MRPTESWHKHFLKYVYKITWKPLDCWLFDQLNLLILFGGRIRRPISWRYRCQRFYWHRGRHMSWCIMISEKNIEKIVFRALSNVAICILLRCSGVETYRFLMLHSKRIILYLLRFILSFLSLSISLNTPFPQCRFLILIKPSIPRFSLKLCLWVEFYWKEKTAKEIWKEEKREEEKKR